MAVDSNFVQASFLGGEWSAFAQGRIDKPDYKTAMNVCRNGFPIEEGAWLRRSGTRFAAATLNGTSGRVVPFAFNQSSPYLMEFTDSALRMFAVATQTGGLTGALPNDFRLVTTNDNQQVVSVSTANPAVVQTAGAHGWSTDDQVQFLFASTVAPAFTPLLRNRVFEITVVDTTHFSLTDPFSETGIDGSTLGWAAVIAGQAVVARVLQIATPYATGAWSAVRRVQAETTAILLHGSYPPETLVAATSPAPTAFATFSLSVPAFSDGPYLDPPTDGTTAALAWTLAIPHHWSITLSSVASVNGGVGFVATDVGRLLRIQNQPAAWAVGTAYTVGQSVTFNGAFFTCIGANTGQEPDISVAYWSITPAAAVWYWGKITGILTTSSVFWAPDASQTLPSIGGGVTLTTTTNFRLGVYSNTTGWPSCGTYFEGRLWLSGAVSNRVDASVPNQLFNFAPTAPDGTVSDASGISYVFNAEDVNPIFWMLGTATGIICGALVGEWVIQASQLADPITPTSIQAHRVTKYGCANVEPEHTELTVSFVHRYGRKVLEYFPDVFSGRYTAPNLSHSAKHLTTSGISEIRYQHDLSPTIWARCGNGSLIGAAYKRSSLFSSQGPDFIGWHRHDLGSGRTVKSIAVGPSANGTLDALSMVTLDATTGVYHVELLNDMFDVNAPITAGWFLDDAVVPSGAVITGNITLGGTITFYGLWHLNGKTVTVSCGGVDAGDAVVANGAVTVPIDGDVGTAFTTAYLSSISSSTAYGAMTVPVTTPLVGGGTTTLYVPAVVGFTYTSQGQILRPDSVDQTRGQTGPGMGKAGRAHQFAALMSGAQGISFGTDFGKTLHTANFRQLNQAPFAATQLYSGIYWDTVDDTFSFDGQLAWQITRPYPAAVVSIAMFQQNQDR